MGWAILLDQNVQKRLGEQLASMRKNMEKMAKFFC